MRYHYRAPLGGTDTVWTVVPAPPKNHVTSAVITAVMNSLDSAPAQTLDALLKLNNMALTLKFDNLFMDISIEASPNYCKR